MDYKVTDLPVDLHHEDMVDVGGGVVVRFETNGEAKDVYLGEAFTPTVQLFPACDYTFEAGGCSYKLTALFEDKLRVEKI
jgi:hypothetical protein